MVLNPLRKTFLYIYNLMLAVPKYTMVNNNAKYKIEIRLPIYQNMYEKYTGIRRTTGKNPGI